MGYAKEFNHLEYNVPEFLTPWTDVSWHNDVCPRFENYTLMLAVWVDCNEPERREYEDWKQYSVCTVLTHGGDDYYLADETLFATEDAEKLEAWLDMYVIKQHLEQAFLLSGKYGERFADELASLIAEATESMVELHDQEAPDCSPSGEPC
jgi:hypothetical protein